MLATKLVSTTAARTKAAMSSKMMAMEAMVGFGVAEWTDVLLRGLSVGHGWRALFCHRIHSLETGGCSLRVCP